MPRLLFVSLALVVGLAGPGLSAPAPQVHIATLKELPVVLPKPYDETMGVPAANAVVDKAFAMAKSNGKLVLIDLGGNWCPDCVVLANVMQVPEVKAFVAAHYEVAVVDVGRYNKNLQVPARFGVTSLHAAPTVLIAKPDGKLINAGHIEALADARAMTPQAIADWLAQWTD